MRQWCFFVDTPLLEKDFYDSAAAGDFGPGLPPRLVCQSDLNDEWPWSTIIGVWRGLGDNEGTRPRTCPRVALHRVRRQGGFVRNGSANPTLYTLLRMCHHLTLLYGDTMPRCIPPPTSPFITTRCQCYFRSRC